MCYTTFDVSLLSLCGFFLLVSFCIIILFYFFYQKVGLSAGGGGVMRLCSIIMNRPLSLLVGNTCDYILLANHLTGSSSSGPVIVPELISRYHVVVSEDS